MMEGILSIASAKRARQELEGETSPQLKGKYASARAHTVLFEGELIERKQEPASESRCENVLEFLARERGMKMMLEGNLMALALYGDEMSVCLLVALF
jgi:hypothetical protein